MKRKLKIQRRAYIQNNINQEIIEVELSQKDVQTILRYKRVLCNNLSKTKIFDDSIIMKIEVVHMDKNILNTFGGQVFIYENNIIEYFVDDDMLIQNYILGKAYKHNYDRLKEVVYMDSFSK